MSEDYSKTIVAITDNSQAGRIVVRRALRLGAILNLPVDIHRILDVPNGGKVTSELLDHSLNELIVAEQELSQALHESVETRSAHAAVEPELKVIHEGFVTFLTEEIRNQLDISGLHYLAFQDSQKQLDLSQVALLCGRNSNPDHLKLLSGLMKTTESAVKVIMEETGVAFWNDLLGDLGLTKLPVETYRDDRKLQEIIKSFSPSLICLPVEIYNAERISWIRGIHSMDILLY